MTDQLEAIARRHLLIDTLERRNNDDLDFYDVSVWGVRDALQAAYKAGFEDGRLTTPILLARTP